MNKLDKQYTDLLQDILDNGVTKQDRTGTGTISVFGRQIRHSMKDGFPLLTTKKMPFKTIVTELLWFLRGDTNIKYLVDNNCHIWNGDAYKRYWYNWRPIKEDCGEDLTPYTQEEFINEIKTDDEFAKNWGELGPIYGKQWRSWGISQKVEEKMSDGRYRFVDKVINPIDQIANLINDLKTNPDSRRLLVSAWAVHDLQKMVLPPCHYGFQVYTRELSMEERIKQIPYSEKHTIFEERECIDELRTLKGKELQSFQKYIKEQCDKINIPTRAISLMWNQRSVDTFLGLPFNIASYGLLLEIIAKEVNMVPDELIGNLGDVHLYSNHIDAAKEQIGRELTNEERNEWCLINQCGGNIRDCKTDWKDFELDQQNVPKRTREPFPLPTLKFNPCPITGISMEYQSISQFEIQNYQSHPTIKAPLSN